MRFISNTRRRIFFIHLCRILGDKSSAFLSGSFLILFKQFLSWWFFSKDLLLITSTYPNSTWAFFLIHLIVFSSNHRILYYTESVAIDRRNAFQKHQCICELSVAKHQKFWFRMCYNLRMQEISKSFTFEKKCFKIVKN